MNPFLALIALSTLGLPLLAQDKNPHPGKQAFKTNCAACHLTDVRVVGPSSAEVARNYTADNLADFIS